MKGGYIFKEVIRTIKGTWDGGRSFKLTRQERRERKPMDFADMVIMLFFITVWLAMILFFISAR